MNTVYIQGYDWRKGDGYIMEVYKSSIMMVFDRFGEAGVNNIYRELYICLYRHRLEKKQVRYETMAKASNSAWIFQAIHNAKSLSDQQAIRQAAQKAKSQTVINYEVEEILSVFKN